MCFTDGNQSSEHYEATRPSRPMAPVYKADKWEKPREAPLVPPNPQARKKAKAHVKQNLRNAEKVKSNRHKERFAISNSSADKIRESALAKARENSARAPPPRPAPMAQPVIEDDSSAYPAPLNIRKKTPHQPPPPQQQRSARREELGNTVPALRNNTRRVDQNHNHPALRGASSSRPTDQSHIYLALRNSAWPTAEIHPALRNLPPNATPPRRLSDQSQSSLERDVYSYLGNPLNYADSPRESDVSPVNVAQNPPYCSSRTK